MKMNNPMFSALSDASVSGDSSRASLKGVINKTTLLLLVVVSVALFVMFVGFNSLSYGMLMVSSIVGFIAVMVGRMNAKAAMVAGLIYSVCEGIFLGALTAIADTFYPGAAAIAVVGTFSIFMVMLCLYRTKIIQATATFYKVMAIVGLSLLVFSLFSVILSLFGNNAISGMFYGNSTMAVILCIGFIMYGSFMLVINFEEAKSYADNGFDKNYEWCAALGLIVTVVYIYVQVLRFVMIIMSKAD